MMKKFLLMQIYKINLFKKNLSEHWHGGETVLILINLPILGFSKALYP